MLLGCLKNKMGKEKLEEKLIDSECIFHKRKKDNIANHINSTYSHMLDIVCKGCDGYNLSCKDYTPSKKEYKKEFYIE